MLLGLGGLLAGMGVLDLQDAAHLVVGIILHPAVGIPHLRDSVHVIVGVGSDAVPGVSDGHDPVHGVKTERRRSGTVLCIIFYACFLALIIELLR